MPDPAEYGRENGRARKKAPGSFKIKSSPEGIPKSYPKGTISYGRRPYITPHSGISRPQSGHIIGGRCICNAPLLRRRMPDPAEGGRENGRARKKAPGSFRIKSSPEGIPKSYPKGTISYGRRPYITPPSGISRPQSGHIIGGRCICNAPLLRHVKPLLAAVSNRKDHFTSRVSSTAWRRASVSASAAGQTRTAERTPPSSSRSSPRASRPPPEALT